MAKLLEQIIGHEEIVKRIAYGVKSKSLPSTFLFVGPSGVGRKAVALAAAQALICPEDGCGFCPSCLRVEKGNSEGVLLIAPDKNAARASIKIEQAQRIKEFLSLKSLTRSRVVIIDKVEVMNPSTANSLLKLFEEPPQEVYFFLIAPSSQHVLPTIKSRSQVLVFRSLTMDEMKKKVKAPEWVLRACRGSLERVHFFQDREELDSREQALEFLDFWRKDPEFYLLPEWKEFISDRSKATRLSFYLNLILRDLVFIKMGANESELINVDKMNYFQDWGTVSVENIYFLIEKALKIEKALTQNQDLQLIFEKFWLETQWQSGKDVMKEFVYDHPNMD